MLLPDVNLLVHAHNSNSPRYAAARQWWEVTLSEMQPVGLAWVTALGFIRITTHRGIFVNPLPVADAIARVRAWLEHPAVRIVTPSERHADILFRLLLHLGTAGNLTTDVHLAALAIEYRAQLVSTDADFARFPGLRWMNPL